MSALDPAKGQLALGVTVALGIESDFDYNNAARVVITTALGEIPAVGALLSALVDIFWPSPTVDVWAMVEARVEALVNQKIAERVWQQVSEALAGLQNVLDDYIYAAQNFPNDPRYISEKYNVAQGHFLHDLPAFQSKGYELLLLPLFAQFANLHLGLMRDGVAFGAQWGWGPEIIARVKQQLVEAIGSYTAYTDKIYTSALEQRKAQAPSNPAKTEPFNYVNRFVREMTLTVNDFRAMWQYYDISKYPTPPAIYLDREIYSDAVGTSHDSAFTLPTQPPTLPISRVIVWGWDRIDAAEVDYPPNGGPDGRSTTGRMGNSSGGSNMPPHGGSFDTTRNPITLVRARTGDILNALWFQFKDGSWSNKLGGNYPGGGDHDFTYPGEILSSIKIMGVSRFYGSANCAVFGFKFEHKPQPSAELLQRMYRTSPEAVSPTELARRLGASEQTVRDVAAWAEQNHWSLAREQHWQLLAARVNRRETH
ncbi:insecticidal delta-endotoxin Cry8Ea1 family protein [Tahibacter amnicola]|uniref:Insecticidal delta-endotoxin Cry8Ea1 family protein n=1 Tax=Tahibacter amnicola TaxID=2976241 RepID=A0ABY6BG12_9GAMM|nr:insecticidal delta-endotoxin Cry8Ea1 family protein [Tahibacter amnicola]UXI68959.1 insecticidal delta-endotoxin Cry8Ea1 family protein [Tahibacter amnicola]